MSRETALEAAERAAWAAWKDSEHPAAVVAAVWPIIERQVLLEAASSLASSIAQFPREGAHTRARWAVLELQRLADMPAPVVGEREEKP